MNSKNTKIIWNPGLKMSIFLYAENEEVAQPLIPSADALISIGRWLTPEIVQSAIQLRWMQCTITGTGPFD